MLKFIASDVVVYIPKRVTARNDEGGRGKKPFELIEFCGEGIGEDEIIMDEFSIGTTRAIRNAPAEGFEGTGKDLANAMAILEADFVCTNFITEAAGLDDGEETPANLGFFLLGEFDGDEAGREGTIEHGPEAFADASGIDDNVLGMPGFGKIFEFAKNRNVIFADPTMAGDDMIGGVLERFECGEVNTDDGEGGRIPAGVTEAEIGGMEGVDQGFIHAGDVDEEPHRPHPHVWGQDPRPLLPHPQPLLPHPRPLS